MLKAAFIQGRLTKDELDQRVGQALAARSCAELAALTADLPAGLTAAQPLQPARAQGEQAILRGPGRVLALATVVYAAVWPVALALPVSGPDHDPHAGVALAGTATLVYFFVFLGTVVQVCTNWQDRRAARRSPPRPAPGAGGQGSVTPPSTSPGEQLPPSDQGRSHTATAARRRRPPSVLLGPRSLRQWHPRALPAATAGNRLP